MAEFNPIYLGGCDIEWIGAKVNSSGTYLDGDDAIVFSLYASDLDTDNENGTVVAGASGLSMTHDGGTTGNFVGHLPASVSLTRNGFYWFEATATPSGGTPHTRRVLVKAVDHGLTP